MNDLAWVVLLPFLGAVGCLLVRGRAIAWTGMLTSLVVFLACANLLVLVWEHGPARDKLGGWAAPLGIGLYLDGLGALFLILTAVVGVLVGLYATRFFAQGAGQRRMGGYFWPLWLLMWGGLNGVYLCSDVFNAYVLLEICALSAVGMTVLAGNTASLVSGLRYLLATMFGSMMYLLGVGLLYAGLGQLDFFWLAGETTPTLSTLTALGLMTFGLLIKAALLPFHFWLPPAHSAAPAPVSAILSPLVTKASFFLLLRLWFVAFPFMSGQPLLEGWAEQTHDSMLSLSRVPDFAQTLGWNLGQFIGVLGGLAVIWGSLQAVRQDRLKLLIAYSTVGQLGYLFLHFPLLGTSDPGPWTVTAWTAMVFHVFSHGLAKAALFLSAGCLLLAMGTDDLRAMRDIAGRMPVVTFTLAVAGISLMGLPPSAGFVAKWMLLRAVMASGQWWWALVIAVGGLLTAAYVFKILAYTFVPSGNDKAPLRPVPAMMTLTALALAVICAVLGFRAEEVIALLPHAPQEFPVPALGCQP